ncbi:MULTISPECIES: hypothetical protein [unclassified Achromobacter]|uniref:hypothetical protein n=1 Tax=unclassified Achromobacter TaxID=2626865 RepID=UPI00069D3436|nr:MULTISPECIES: hypothetical protein [unclassified Achromobacter]KOF54387.1 hypothetical protein AD428_07340 [Achromobacter sp. DMS1]
MSMQTLSRCGVALFLAALVSGCSFFGSGDSDRERTAARVSDECRGNRSRCLYEGSYEPGERDYAEEEAKRLNRAESARLRRVFGN